MQNFAALALIGSSLSVQARIPRENEIMYLEKKYTYNGTSNSGKEIKIVAEMEIDGDLVPEDHFYSAFIFGTTSIWVDDTAYSVEYD